jgi:hypothetical protein
MPATVDGTSVRMVPSGSTGIMSRQKNTPLSGKSGWRRLNSPASCSVLFQPSGIYVVRPGRNAQRPYVWYVPAVNSQGRSGPSHWPGAPGTRYSGPVHIGIGVDSARADGWNEGAVDEIIDDGSAAAVGAIDGWEEAGEAVLHAVVTNAAATIEIARHRHGDGILSG